MADLGKTLILFGALIVAVGLLLTLGGKLPWIGRLPGDITIRKNGVVLYFPIASCLVASVLLSLILSLFRR